MSDDSGLFTDGTVVNKAFVDQVYDQVDDQCHSSTNPTVKPKATTDEVVAARGSKASLDARLDVALNEDGTPKAVAGQASESQVALEEGNFNVVLNADLADWTSGGTSAPDNYTLSGAGAAILKSGPAQADTTDLGVGEFCARVTSGGGAAARLTQAVISAANFSKFRAVRGRKVGLVVRGKTSTGSALRVVVDDGVTTTVSSYHAGDGNEAYLTALHTISNSATKLDVYAEVASGALVAYVGGFTVVFSDIAPAAWVPLWAKFRRDILDAALPAQVKIGAAANRLTVDAGGLLDSSHTVSTKTANNEDFYTISVPAGRLKAGQTLRLRCLIDVPNTTAQNISPIVRLANATDVTVTSAGSGVTARMTVDVILQIVSLTSVRVWGGGYFHAVSAGSGTPYQFFNSGVTVSDLSANALDLRIRYATTGTRTADAQGYTLELLGTI